MFSTPDTCADAPWRPRLSRHEARFTRAMGGRNRRSSPSLRGRPAPPEEESVPSRPLDEPSGTRAVAPCILIVDDHVDTREAVAEYLRMSGFRTVEAENGAVAIKTAREQLPDAILLDYAMPVMNGVQAALCLKRDPRTQAIPIVMITAYSEGARQRGRCDDYLPKPCAPREVVDKIRALLPKAASRDATAEPAGDPAL